MGNNEREKSKFSIGQAIVDKRIQDEQERMRHFSDWTAKTKLRKTRAALYGLVHFVDNLGNMCFCGQWKDPENLQHSGACLDAQDVLGRADFL